MPRPAVSIVIATYNRAHLLKRSLFAYANSSFKDFELCIVNDDSKDETAELIYEWQDKLDIKHICLRKSPGLWRDAASILNIGIRAAGGDLVCITHPEVIPGKRTIELAHAAKEDNTYINAKVYFLDQKQQELIDTVDWQSNLLNVRQLPDFYRPSVNGFNNDYEHISADTMVRWESFVWSAMSRATWRMMGGITEYNTWGSFDPHFMTARHILNIRNNTLMDHDSLVCHQNHDVATKHFEVTDRSMEKCMGAIKPLRRREDCIVDNL